MGAQHTRLTAAMGSVLAIVPELSVQTEQEGDGAGVGWSRAAYPPCRHRCRFWPARRRARLLVLEARQTTRRGWWPGGVPTQVGPAHILFGGHGSAEGGEMGRQLSAEKGSQCEEFGEGR